MAEQKKKLTDRFYRNVKRKQLEKGEISAWRRNLLRSRHVGT